MASKGHVARDEWARRAGVASVGAVELAPKLAVQLRWRRGGGGRQRGGVRWRSQTAGGEGELEAARSGLAELVRGHGMSGGAAALTVGGGRWDIADGVGVGKRAVALARANAR